MLVADVRLDNRQELATLLNLAPQQAIKISDNDFLLRAWQQWGEDCVERLLGGFAFACFDAGRRRLFLARDHGGEKPLFYACLPELFAFASMPKGLHSVPGVGCELNHEKIAEYLAVITNYGSATLFERIERVLPGHCVTATSDGCRVRRYWDPCDAPPLRYRKDADYVEAFHERFEAAVRARLRSTGEVASELSGGLDSSSVTSTAANLLQEESKGLIAYTSVPLPEYGGEAPRGRFGDEGPAAAEVAAMYPNIKHVRLNVAGQDMVAVIERITRLTGMPVFNPTNQMWVNAILDHARGHKVSALLEGVAGNATISFGGLIGLRDLFWSGQWFALARRVHRLRANGHTSWRGAAAWSLGSLHPLWLLRMRQPGLYRNVLHHCMLNPARADESGLRDRAFAELYGPTGTTRTFRQKFYAYYDPGVVNWANSEGWGIATRDPTRDKRVFEFCYGIPIEQYLVGDQARSLVRRAMQGRLPASTLTRTTRGLQAADWYVFMGTQRAQMRAALERIAQSPLAQHLLDIPRMRTLLERWPTSGYERDDISHAYQHALSRGLSVGLFIAQHDEVRKAV